MKLKIITWNIGGGKILAEGKEVGPLASYVEDGWSHIVETLVQQDADIISLQETHKNKSYDLVEALAKELGYEHFFHDSTSPSHIDKNYSLGHGIISKYPISDHIFKKFHNPKLQTEWEDGSIATSFDKGFSAVSIDVGIPVTVTTTHLIPFRRFGVEMNTETADLILKDFEDKVPTQDAPWIVMGDFNIDSPTIQGYFPNTFKSMSEINLEESTTPRGKKYDHILFKGFKVLEHKVLSSVKTDHYPVLATIELI